MVADILKEWISPYGNVFRCGGDEFCLIFIDCTWTIIESCMNKIQESIRLKAMEHTASCVRNTVSVSQGGIVHIPKVGETLEDWMELADQRLYQIKNDRRGGYLIEEV